ncbi:MAG: TetR/AcrR family transcriptional regulator [Acidimicrobiales bacterium]|jgi:AcrR family transcriptional regulator
MRHATAPPPSPESLTASQFARRERIVKVALNLLVNGDYEKIQMKDVAEASDVALGTVYRYFTSKEHLFAAVQLEWVKSLHRQILRRPPTGQSNLERLSRVLHKSVRAFQLQPQFYRVLLVLEVAKDPFAKELFEVMSRETEATYGESLSGVDPKTASDLLRVVLAVLGAELRSWVLGRQSIDEVKQNLDATLSLLLTYRDPTSVDAAAAERFAT